MRSHLPLLLLLLFAHGACLGADTTPRVIFDTDFGGDADDLGALAMLHNMMTAGECELLAVMNWNTERYALPAIVALNRFYGHPDVAVGTRRGEPWQADWQYSKAVVDALNAPATATVPGATGLYRELLATADTGSVTVVTVGPLANILDLLESGPDRHSPMSGRQLVREKVRKFVIMGGNFPAGEHEWNFDGDMPGVTRDVLASIDVPVIFSGYEVGDAIRTGTSFNDLDDSHPLHAGFLHFSKHAPWMKDRFDGRILDNASFDQSAVLFAVRGGVGLWWELSAPGRVIADAQGGNDWQPDPDGKHRYLVLSGDPDDVAAVIQAAMLGR
jgi:hypothetical protein